MPNSGSDDDGTRSKFAGRWIVNKAGEDAPTGPEPETPLMVNGVPVIDPSQAFTDQIRNDAAVFDGRRLEVREITAELRRQEIEATLGTLTDPTMQWVRDTEKERIEDEYEKVSVERLAKIDVEQEQAVHRALRQHDHYDRLQLETEEQVVEVERVRLETELQDARDEAAKEVKKAEDRADLEYGDGPIQADEKDAHLRAVKLALNENLEKQTRQIEEEARQRLERMLEPYAPHRGP